MSINEHVADIAGFKEAKQKRSARINLIIVLAIGLLALSPALLGIYWEIILP